MVAGAAAAGAAGAAAGRCWLGGRSSWRQQARPPQPPGNLVRRGSDRGASRGARTLAPDMLSSNKVQHHQMESFQSVGTRGGPPPPPPPRAASFPFSVLVLSWLFCAVLSLALGAFFFSVVPLCLWHWLLHSRLACAGLSLALGAARLQSPRRAVLLSGPASVPRAVPQRRTVYRLM